MIHLPTRISAIRQATAVWLELRAKGLGKVFYLVGRLRGVQRGQILRGGQRVDHRTILNWRVVLLAAKVRWADLVGGRGSGGVLLLLHLVGELLRRGELLVRGGLQAAQVEAVLW